MTVLTIIFMLTSGQAYMNPSFPPIYVESIEVCERKKLAAEEYFNYHLKEKKLPAQVLSVVVKCVK